MIENIRLSFKGILSHKIRSFLTMLGIIIGIAAIIAIVSTIKGTNEQIKNNLIGSGSNTVTVQLSHGDEAYDFTWESIPYGVGEITDEIKQEILDLDEVESCSLYRERDYYDNIFYRNNQLSGGSIIGIDEDYFTVNNYSVTNGKGFSPSDYTTASKVAILDSNASRGMFDGENPVGEVIDINGEPYTVIGVVVQNSEFEPVINSVEDYQTYMSSSSGTVFITSGSWPVVFGYDEPQNVAAKAIDTDSMTSAGKKTAEILNSYLYVDDDSSTIEYKSESLLEQAKSLQELSSSTNSMLIWIASISLLVGGIGVMNIMLVSVTERTREIGLKKALGARKKRILMQFLTEASVLTSIGGIIGVGAGIGLSQIIAKVAEVPVAISTSAIIISVVFSMVVGIVFGLIPSIKASNLNPIDALRYE